MLCENSSRLGGGHALRTRKFPNETQGVGRKKFYLSVPSAQDMSAVKMGDLTGIKGKHNSCVRALCVLNYCTHQLCLENAPL